jgi:hypothetical protein
MKKRIFLGVLVGLLAVGAFSSGMTMAASRLSRNRRWRIRKAACSEGRDHGLLGR